jgi:glycosyltransferase involved in cell wall biosynthesis
MRVETDSGGSWVTNIPRMFISISNRRSVIVSKVIILSSIPYGNIVPMISVIIPVYDRRDLYRQALRSLKTQTVSPSEFEVIIVSNIHIAVPDLPFRTRVFFTEDTSLAGKLVIGIEKSEGSVISFLEDDDIFLSSKLSEVKDAFDSQVVLYRNRMIQFQGEEYPVKFNEKVGREKPVIILSNPSSIKDVFEMMRFGINFNLSSLSVRRSFALSVKGSLAMLMVGYIDSFLFYSAVVKNKMIGYCSYGAPSTLVRVHKANSRDYFSSKKGSVEAEALHEAILSLTERDTLSPSSHFILMLIRLDEMDESIKVRRPGRRIVLSGFLDLISNRYTFLLRRDLVVKSILYLISPSFMNILLASFRKL